VLVKTIDSENELVNTIAEFFITKRYRRRGLGESAAQQVFDRFPGKWLVTQIEKNIPAQTFWRKIISEFTNGEYEDSFSSGKRRQTFVSPAR
jgi:predicted acetyltransferase